MPSASGSTRSLLPCGRAAVVALGLACLPPTGCSDGIPLPRSPQLEGLSRELNVSHGDRLAAYDACVAASKDETGLVKCMEKSGYRPIGGVGDPRADECRMLAESPDHYPRAYCFEPLPRAPAAE